MLKGVDPGSVPCQKFAFLPWQGEGESRNSPAAEERELLVESLGQHSSIVSYKVDQMEDS